MGKTQVRGKKEMSPKKYCKFVYFEICSSLALLIYIRGRDGSSIYKLGIPTSPSLVGIILATKKIIKQEQQDKKVTKEGNILHYRAIAVDP